MVIPAGSNGMLSLQFTVWMSPLGFSVRTSCAIVWLWSMPCSFASLHASKCSKARLCLQYHTSFPCLVGGAFVPSVTGEHSALFPCGSKTRTFGPWWFWDIVTSPLVFSESVQENRLFPARTEAKVLQLNFQCGLPYHPCSCNHRAPDCSQKTAQ